MFYRYLAIYFARPNRRRLLLLLGTRQNRKRVKRLYRRKLLECITQEPCWEIALHGKRWNAFCKDWQKEALQNFDERFGNDFLRFAPKARADFRASLKRAEEAGVFKEDEAEYIEMVRELFENL